MLYIIAGHGAGDPGAIGNGYREADLARALCARMAEMGGDSVTYLDSSRNWFRDGGISRYRFAPNSQIVEEHLDSFAGPGPRGAHVCIGSGMTPDATDRTLGNVMGAILPGRSQLVTAIPLSNASRAAARGIPYRLVENGFITNKTDVGIFFEQLDHIAQAQLEAFGISVNVEKPRPNHPTKEPGGSSMFRLFNENNGRHFYTSDANESQALQGMGWVLEGEAWKSNPNEVPIYRLCSKNGMEHLLTINKAERDGLMSAGWTYEGIEGYSKGDVNVYRLYNPNNGDHVYTTSNNEVGALEGSGWHNEGVAFFAEEE